MPPQHYDNAENANDDVEDDDVDDTDGADENNADVLNRMPYYTTYSFSINSVVNDVKFILHSFSTFLSDRKKRSNAYQLHFTLTVMNLSL